ncbi:hypothetical protein IAT38_002337 [Cryptococcus sp. DSM 104549]
MSSRTYASGQSWTSSNANAMSSPVSPDNAVRCTAHQRKANKFTAGPTSKNTGRSFYCCPLPKGDPSRCKFFKWVDDVHAFSAANPSPSKPPTTPSASSSSASTFAGSSGFVSAGKTLGQSPQKPYGTPTSSRVIKPVPARAAGRSGSVLSISSDDDGSIDWGNIDMDELEQQAIKSSQESARKHASQSSLPSSGVVGGAQAGSSNAAASAVTPSAQRTQVMMGAPGSAKRASFAARMKEVLESGSEKRERVEDDEDGERTPKRAHVEPSNPFISPNVMSPPHAELLPTVSSLEQLSEHLHRQDRLVRAAEVMKQGMRKTIKSLQDKNKELEARVKELESFLENDNE